MTNVTDLTGLASVASAIAASLLLLPGLARLTKMRQAWLPGAVFVLMLIPFGTMPLAAYVRGVTGDLSITTLVLSWCALLGPWCGSAKVNNRFALLILIALAALALYPMSLGASAYDPYRLGYGDPQFVAALLLLALAAWFRKSALVALCIAIATFAWAVGWYESDNLWDYLLDPFVALYALAAIMICGVKRLLKLQREGSH
jgi:energy-converting hydrogenase Eha subunit A